jgi:hypothetical protein
VPGKRCDLQGQWVVLSCDVGVQLICYGQRSDLSNSELFRRSVYRRMQKPGWFGSKELGFALPGMPCVMPLISAAF